MTNLYYVACPALGESEEMTDLDRAMDICYSMHEELILMLTFVMFTVTSSVNTVMLWKQSNPTFDSLFSCNLSFNKSMDNYNDYMDTLLQEIMDLPAEIYDIPEMQEEEFDVEGYINGNTDY